MSTIRLEHTVELVHGSGSDYRLAACRLQVPVKLLNERGIGRQHTHPSRREQVMNALLQL